MTRPCFLVVDREYSGSISTRKLVIETAKLNVITAYSAQEAIETLQRFPKVDGIVIDAAIRDMPCTDLVHKIRELEPGHPVVIIDAPGSPHCPGATHYLASFDPAKLLELLKSFDPEKAAKIEAKNEDLSRTQG